jgi:hypothetical protein
VTVSVTSPTFATVAKQDYSFVLDVQYCKTNSFTIQPIPDIDYLINSGTENFFYQNA